MIFRVIGQLIYTVLAFIEVFVALRFVLKLIGADAGNDFVALVYRVSQIFVEPFRGIVENIHAGQLELDSAALIALVVYMIIAFAVVEIIKAFKME